MKKKCPRNGGGGNALLCVYIKKIKLNKKKLRILLVILWLKVQILIGFSRKNWDFCETATEELMNFVKRLHKKRCEFHQLVLEKQIYFSSIICWIKSQILSVCIHAAYAFLWICLLYTMLYKLVCIPNMMSVRARLEIMQQPDLITAWNF